MCFNTEPVLKGISRGKGEASFTPMAPDVMMLLQA